MLTNGKIIIHQNTEAKKFKQLPTKFTPVDVLERAYKVNTNIKDPKTQLEALKNSFDVNTEESKIVHQYGWGLADQPDLSSMSSHVNHNSEELSEARRKLLAKSVKDLTKEVNDLFRTSEELKAVFESDVAKENLKARHYESVRLEGLISRTDTPAEPAASSTRGMKKRTDEEEKTEAALREQERVDELDRKEKNLQYRREFEAFAAKIVEERDREVSNDLRVPNVHFFFGKKTVF
jgi:hypothetical protein